MTELMLRAMLAASGIGLIAGMLGCFVVWRRMAYMGDAMGHASLLGVVLGLMLGVLPLYAVVAVAVILGLGLSQIQKDKRLPFDALLGVISTGGLALGLLLYTSLPNRQVDLYGYLFGDVLAVSTQQIAIIYGALAIQLVLVYINWRSLMRMIVHEEIARVENVPVAKLQALMTVMIAVTVALALQVVGMLLVTALLVIPPLTSRLLATTPLQMVVGSMLLGVAASAGGIALSYQHNLTTGPSIVAVAIGLFIAALALGKMLKRVH